MRFDFLAIVEYQREKGKGKRLLKVGCTRGVLIWLEDVECQGREKEKGRLDGEGKGRHRRRQRITEDAAGHKLQWVALPSTELHCFLLTCRTAIPCMLSKHAPSSCYSLPWLVRTSFPSRVYPSFLRQSAV